MIKVEAPGILPTARLETYSGVQCQNPSYQTVVLVRNDLERTPQHSEWGHLLLSKGGTKACGCDGTRLALDSEIGTIAAFPGQAKMMLIRLQGV